MRVPRECLPRCQGEVGVGRQTIHVLELEAELYLFLAPVSFYHGMRCGVQERCATRHLTTSSGGSQVGVPDL